jgi:hypothetical protein
MPEMPNYNEGDATFGFGPFYEKMKEADWSNPAQTARNMFEEVTKFDYRSTYSKFMALSALFWIVPEEVRVSKSAPTSEAERAFDLLWLSYERWIAQGLTHYAQVAAELGKFYSQLRWGMATQQASHRSHENFEQVIATEVADYLERVRILVKDSYTHFEGEIDTVSKKINDIGNTQSTEAEVAASAPTDQTDEQVANVPRRRRHRTKP